jgi:hypothetical protein
MSNHLIQPIDIDGTLYCCDSGGFFNVGDNVWDYPNWRTIDFVDGDIAGVASEGTSSWDLLGSPGPFYESGSGSIRFATCCLWKATIIIQNDNPGYPCITTVRLEINDVLIEEITTDDLTIEIVVDLNDLGLMGRACGNLWAISVEVPDYGVPFGQISIDIEDVTFGPPV